MDVENSKRDITRIIKLVSNLDHSDKTELKKIIEQIKTKELFNSEYGERYIERINNIYNDQEHSKICVLCQKEIASDGVVCSECKSKIGKAVGINTDTNIICEANVMQENKSSNESEDIRTNILEEANIACDIAEENNHSYGEETIKSTIHTESTLYQDESISKLIKNGTEATGKALNQFTEKVNSLAGGEGAVKLRVRDLFSEVFKKHDSLTAEEIFICGTEKTTPTVENIMTEWPRPWLYTRVVFYMLIAFYMLKLCFTTFQNTNVLPGIMIIGSMVVPFAVLIFFFEVNAPRNISIFDVVKIFCVGGCASLLATLTLFEIFPVGSLNFIGAISVGIIEEVGKLIITAFYIKRNPKCDYLLNGLLIGAAVGAGFAAFESAGYAFRICLSGNFNGMMDNIYLRGFLAPGGHVAWAAMSGFAIVLVKKKMQFKWDMLSNKKFINIFIMPIIMHAIWDMPIAIGGSIPVIQLALCVVAWIIILVFINNGLNEINIQQQAQNSLE